MPGNLPGAPTNTACPTGCEQRRCRAAVCVRRARISAQRRGLDPHAYLKDLLTRLAAMTTKDDLQPLLPARW